MIAIRKKNFKLYQSLLNKKDIDVNLQNNEGNSILHLASKMQNETFLNEILNNPKIDINIQNKQMNTPLHLAIEENNKLLAILLIKNDKCNLSLTNNEEMTPLMLAFDKRQEEIVNLIISIPRNININIKDNKGILHNSFFNMAIIHHAAKSYNYEFFISLLKRQDIDINIKTSYNILIFCYYIIKLQ